MRIRHSLVRYAIIRVAVFVVVLCAMLGLSSESAHAQLNVSVTVVPPYSPNLDVWMSNPSRVVIMIINTDPSTAYDIRLSGSAKNSDESVSMETKPDAPSPRIHIPAGAVKQLSLNDFKIFDANTVRFKGTNASQLARTRTLPEGMYQLCVQAQDYKSHNPLSPDAPSGCASFEIKNVDAPILTQPEDGAKMEPTRAQLLQFQWLAPIGAPPNTQYQFSLVQLEPKQNPEAAFRGIGRMQGLTRDGITMTSLMLQSSELKMFQGKAFAWRVRAIDPAGATAFKNDGYSPAHSFEIGGGIIVVKPKIKMPDTLVAGGFEIVVEKWDSTSKSGNPSLPSGIGCVKFDCSKTKKFTPWLEGTKLKQKSFDVIGAQVQDSASQIHVSEAQLFSPTAKIGDKLMLELPAQSNTIATQLIDKNKLIDFIKFHPKLDCIRVSFHDVEWTPPNKSKVVLTGGTALYPTTPPYPAPPAMLVLDSGFTLAIDSLWINTTDASVQGKLLLPTNIISADTCTRASLKLPKTNITSNCEFYREVVHEDSAYGRWWIGNTGLKIRGQYYVIDFSSTQTAADVTPPLPPSWKGVVLHTGSTDAALSNTVTSNRGYTKAYFTYYDATITTHGFNATLTKGASPWIFRTLEPYGYDVTLLSGSLSVASSELVGGGFHDGIIALPRMAIRGDGGSTIMAGYDSLVVQADQDLFGKVKIGDQLNWGEFSQTTGEPRYYRLEYNATDGPDTGSFYLAARQMNPYFPADSFWHSPVLLNAGTMMESQRIQGVLLPFIHNRKFTIYSPDVPYTPTKKLDFAKETIAKAWMNIIRTGVHSEIDIVCDSAKLGNMQLGDSLRSRYDGKKSFQTSFGICFFRRGDFKPNLQTSAVVTNPKAFMPFQFCESAVWNSELAGEVTLPKPAQINVAFKNMMFTSTAECAGGQVDLSQADSLPYWGVKIVAKDTNKSAGIICARLGVIYLTAAGVSEERHYSKPFWLTWGEMKADGNLGRLFFDYNNVGQRFDGFPFTPQMVGLSDYSAVRSDTARVPGSMNVGALAGALYSYGMVSVHFFGGKMVSLSDYLVENTASPYLARWVREQKDAVYDNPASDLHWQRNWGGGIADFDYTDVRYDSTAQEGFYGTGTATLLEITGGIASSITIRADRSCFSMYAEASHDINMAVVANFSSMGKIWGCGCIYGESLERVVVGGELSSGFGVGASLAARGGAMVAIKMSFTPTQTKLSIQGDMYVLLASSINAEVSGMAELTEDHGAGYIEGYLKGDVSLSTFLTGISAEGELQWHFGIDYQAIQGRVAVGIYGPMSLGMESGVFLGNNVPKDKIWVTDGINSRFAFNKGGLPDQLSGMYAYISISQSVNLYIVSGGYEVYTGIGAFAGTSPPVGSGFGVIGNVGVRIWGEILGGLVSASAYGNLQFIAGIPPAFEGSIGLEACVLWVFCGSVDVHCGFNKTDGFYLN